MNPVAMTASNAAAEAAAGSVAHSNSSESINFVSFNQDNTCVSVAYSDGYKIFNCDPFANCYKKTDGSIGIVQMLFSTSLVLVVGLGDEPSLSPRRLKVINTKRQSTICELTFPTSILAVKMNRTRLVVLLEETIYLYDISTMRLIHTIEIPPNPSGLISLSPDSDVNYLAYPSPPKTNVNTQTSQDINGQPHSAAPVRNGDVIIFNAKTLQPLSVIEAHKTPLALLALSSDGLLLATASDKGTIVRVFSVETGVKLYQFRRGTYPTKIYSLCFSSDGKFLTASSATETIHIFRLGEDEAMRTIPNPPQQIHQLNKTLKDKKNGVKNESSDSENEEDGEPVPTSSGMIRRPSSSSVGSLNSTESADKVEPLIDTSRSSVARILRRTSQTLGRKAAEKMGTYLPPKFSSILEPNRHFASLKVPMAKDSKSVAAIGKEITADLIPSVILENGASGDDASDLMTKKLLHVMVITSEGFFYNFGLDPERGGDCILLNQYSLLNE